MKNENYDFKDIQKYIFSFDEILDKYEDIIKNSKVNTELSKILSEKQTEIDNSNAVGGSDTDPVYGIWRYVVDGKGKTYLMMQSVSELNEEKIAVISVYPPKINIGGKKGGEVESFNSVADLLGSLKKRKDLPFPPLSATDKKFLEYSNKRERLEKINSLGLSQKKPGLYNDHDGR